MNRKKEFFESKKKQHCLGRNKFETYFGVVLNLSSYRPFRQNLNVQRRSKVIQTHFCAFFHLYFPRCNDENKTICQLAFPQQSQCFISFKSNQIKSIWFNRCFSIYILFLFLSFPILFLKDEWSVHWVTMQVHVQQVSLTEVEWSDLMMCCPDENLMCSSYGRFQAILSHKPKRI